MIALIVAVIALALIIAAYHQGFEAGQRAQASEDARALRALRVADAAQYIARTEVAEAAERFYASEH